MEITRPRHPQRVAGGGADRGECRTRLDHHPLFSSKLGRRVKTETGAPYAFRPARKRIVELPTLPPGKRQIAQVGGVNGFAVDYTRRIYRDGRLTAEERFTTRCRPEDTIVEASPPIASEAQPYAAPTLLVAALG